MALIMFALTELRKMCHKKFVGLELIEIIVGFFLYLKHITVKN